ncbi:MAG: 6-pyruvoyl-tetrahydropterin synthase-related protein [Candidatus Nanoarchaeia archaeon]
MKHERINDSAFYAAIMILAAILIYKLIDQAKLIWIFPLDYTNDWASHMAKLFFLAKYGYYNIVPNWYNGFVLFKLYAPGWFFFTLPIFYLTNNIQLTTYLSLLILFILGFIFINMLGKINKFSITKRVAFFLFFFANPVAIGNFIRVGKIPEMFGWIVFIPTFTLVWHYKDHELDWKVILFVLLYSVLIISYLPGFAVGSIIVLSLFLVKPLKEKIIIALAVIISMLATSFWWVNYVLAAKKTMLNDLVFLENLITLNKVNLMENIATTIITAVVILAFYFYWKDKNKSRKELIFFLPVLFITVALLTRLAYLIPYVNKLHPDTYNFFLLFVAIFLFLKTEKYPKAIAKHAWLILTLLAITSVVVSVAFITPFKKHTENDEELLSLLQHVEGKLFIKCNLDSYSNAYYSYAAIYHNISTPEGWATENVPTSYRQRWGEIHKAFDSEDCKKLIAGLKEYDTTNFISSYRGCDILKKCGFKEIKRTANVCLYRL